MSNRKPKRGGLASDQSLARDLRATLLLSLRSELVDLQDNLFRTAARLQARMVETADPREQERLFVILTRFLASETKLLVEFARGPARA